MTSLGRKPRHIDKDVWDLICGLTPLQLAGQCQQIDEHMAERHTKREIRELITKEMIGVVSAVTDVTEFIEFQNLALSSVSKIPLIGAADFERGVDIVAPSGFAQAHAAVFELIYNAARRAARDMAINGTSVVYGPVADFLASLCNGRGQELGAQCILLASMIVVAKILGFQGNGLNDPNAVAAILKHLGIYQGTFDYHPPSISLKRFLEDWWPAQEAGLKAGAAGGMLSFGAMPDDVPCHASSMLARLVRKAATRRGFILVGDHSGGKELVSYCVASDYEDAALQAFTEATMNVSLADGLYVDRLKALVEKNLITLHQLRRMAASVIQLKKDLGVLANPFIRGRPNEEHKLLEFSSEYLALARACITLLRPTCPDPSVLPIRATDKPKVLATGPLGHNRKGMLGAWAGRAWRDPSNTVTLFEGAQNMWGADNVSYAMGTDFTEPDDSWELALHHAGKATHILLALGEHPDWSGEAATRIRPKVPDIQVQFAKALRERTKAKIITSITAGRSLKIPDGIQEVADAIIILPHLGTYAGTAYADVLSGRHNFVGRLPGSHPCDESITEIELFSHRIRNIGRPGDVTNPATWDSRAEPKHANDAAGWCSAPQETGARDMAEFHFGEGGQYSKVEIRDRRVSSPAFSASSTKPIVASALLVNTSETPCCETIRLFWRDTRTPTRRPLMEQIAFQHIDLQPGEEKRVEFSVTPDMLAQYGRKLSEGKRPRPDPERFRVPDYLLIVLHAGEAKEALMALADKDPAKRHSDKALQFVLTE